MLRRTVAILLLLCSVAVNQSPLFVFAGFKLNQGYIVAALCVNRNQPQLHCNGRCYLMKKLQQAQEKEQKQESHFQKIQLQEAIVALPFSFTPYAVAAVYLCVPLTTGIPLSQVSTIFHPPQISC